MKANAHIFFRSSRQDRLKPVISFSHFKKTSSCIFIPCQEISSLHLICDLEKKYLYFSIYTLERINYLITELSIKYNLFWEFGQLFFFFESRAPIQLSGSVYKCI